MLLIFYLKPLKLSMVKSDTKKNKAAGVYKVMWKKSGCYFREGGLGILL